MMEIDKVLDADDGNQEALRLRADIAKQLNPLKAVYLYQELVDEVRARSGPAVQMEIRSMIAQAREQGLAQETQKLNHVLGFMRRYDLHLWPCQVGLARSYEAAGKYQEALTEFQSVWDGVYTTRAPVCLDMLSDIKLGLSRSCFQLGKHKQAIGIAEPFVVNLPHVAGGHKLLAQAMLTKAETSNGWGAAAATKAQATYSTILTRAVELMFKAIWCEAPWNEKNNRANQLFLQELLHKVPIVGDSTSDQAQSVGRRSRKNKKRAAKKSV